MKCSDFIESLYGEDSFAECVSHYRRCPICREKYKSDFELESYLKNIMPDYRDIDLSVSIKREIRNRQIRRRELSIARVATWVLTGLATVYFVIWIGAVFGGWVNLTCDGLQSFGLVLKSLMPANDIKVSVAVDKIISIKNSNELIGILVVICALSLSALFVQSKEYLIKLRLMLNR